MTDTYDSFEIMFAVYGTEDGAAGAVESLRKMDKANTIAIVDAATLVKDAEGRTSVKQESLPSVKKGSGVGALIGGAVGLIFPPSILATAAIGAGLGAGAAKVAKSALENEELKAAADSLEPGTSAFIAVVENTWVTQIQQTIAGYEDLARHRLDAEGSGVIGAIANDSEALMYGDVAADGIAAEFAVATDGSVMAGEATVAAVTEEGGLVIDHTEGVVAADEDGGAAAVVSESVAAMDADGNVAVAESVSAAAFDGPESSELLDDEPDAVVDDETGPEETEPVS